MFLTSVTGEGVETMAASARETTHAKTCYWTCVDELRGRSVVGAAGCGAADGAAGSAGNVFQQDTRNFHEASACGDADCTGEIRSDGFPAAIFTLHRTVADPAIESADIRYGVSAVIGARSEDGAEGRDYGGEGFAARR